MPAIKNITTPDVGGDAVTVIEILVKPGDKIDADTPIVTLESDKATMEVPSSDAGIIKEVKVKVGDNVANGDVIMTIETASADTKEAVKTAEPAKAAAPAPTPIKPAASAPAKQADIHAGPGVRRYAREIGVDLTGVEGSGPKQRILKEDVAGIVQQDKSGSPAVTIPAAPSVDFGKFGSTETVALSRIKKISGKNLQRNWVSIPHVTQFADADITELEAFRQAQKAAMDKEGVKLTPLVFIIKAVIASLKAFPQFNSSLDASGENLILKQYFHIGVAVDTPDGLVVPVIRDADKKGLVDLAKELAVLSDKARKKGLTPADMQGGCFSISSLGGIGGTAFTPIINAPEVAILGVSKASLKPVYENGQFVPRLMLPLSLSYDHRVIDGADGARFIMYLNQMLSDIRNLLM